MDEINFIKTNKTTKKPAAKTDANIGWSKPAVDNKMVKKESFNKDTSSVAANLKTNQPFQAKIKKSNIWQTIFKNLFGKKENYSNNLKPANNDRTEVPLVDKVVLADKNSNNEINYRQELKKEIEKRIGQKGAEPYQAKAKDTPILHLSVKPGIFDRILELFSSKKLSTADKSIKKNNFDQAFAPDKSNILPPAPVNGQGLRDTDNKKNSFSPPDLLLPGKSGHLANAIIKPEEMSKKWENPKIIETNLLSDKLNLYNYKGEIITALTFFILSGLLVASIYGLLFYWQKNKRDRALIEEQRLADINFKINIAKERVAKADNFNSKFKPVLEILNSHIYWTNWFDFLEKNLIKDLKISNFTRDLSGKYRLNATVNNYSQIGETLFALRQNNLVKKADTNAGQMDKSEKDQNSVVSFVLDLEVDQSIFLKPTLE